MRAEPGERALRGNARGAESQSAHRRARGHHASNAATYFSTEIQGYERFDLSQYSASLQQGLPPILGAARGALYGEVGGVHVHGFRERTSTRA
jgi:hypothetical protein